MSTSKFTREPTKRKLPDGMAVRHGKKRDVYYSNYSVDGRQYRGRLASDLPIAKQLLEKQRREAELRAAGLGNDDLALEELATLWLKNRKGRVAGSSYDRYQADLDRCLPMLSVRKVMQLRPGDLARLEDELLDRGNSKSTANQRVSSLTRMLRWGLKSGLLNSNPAAGHEPIQVKKTDLMKVRRALTRPECRKLLECSPEPYRSLWVVYLSTGMRREELLSAEFSWVDWDRQEITVPAGKAKSAVERTIPLNADTLLIFQRQRLKHGNEGRIFDVARGLLYWFYKYAQKAGIKDAKAGGSVDVHSLRGSFATHAIEAGADPKSIQVILGHATIELTLNLYAKATETGKRRAVNCLPSLFDAG